MWLNLSVFTHEMQFQSSFSPQCLVRAFTAHRHKVDNVDVHACLIVPTPHEPDHLHWLHACLEKMFYLFLKVNIL